MKSLTPELLGTVVGADAAKMSGQQLMFGQVQAIAQLKSLLDSAHVNTQQILQIIDAGVRQHATTQQILARIQAQLNNGNTNYGR